MEPPAQQERGSATEGLLLARVDTDHTADAAEFCPFARLTEIEGADDLFAVGTYELQQSTGRRFGSVTLYQLHHAHTAPDASAEEDSHVTLSQRHKIETEEGVLDLKWFLTISFSPLPLFEGSEMLFCSPLWPHAGTITCWVKGQCLLEHRLVHVLHFGLCPLVAMVMN